MADKSAQIRIQICYASPGRQVLKDLTVGTGTSIREAIALSGIDKEAGAIDLSSCKVGIFGKIQSLDNSLREGDRIELYRPLLADPKEARRRRAKKKT